jgi:class 3 adenylate cyclase
VGFTTMSARSSPLAVVRLLNDIFSSFDQLADKYRLEKIKTIGDAYMIVGGLPTPRPDHVAAVADMALDIQKTMGTLDETYPGLSIRVGMHTGPVVAGVIGTKKFSYDLWGDTVNVASRMESHGDPGRIQVTPAVADALRGQFVLESRGVIQVKGRGEMETFWLVSRVEPAAVAPARAAAGPAATT